MRYDPIPASLFVDRRSDFSLRMSPGSVAIFFSNDQVHRSGDQLFPYRQHSAMRSMTGIEQPDTILVMIKRDRDHHEHLFILPHDPHHAVWNGERLTTAQASQISGVTSVRHLHDWDLIMPDVMHHADTVYINRDASDMGLVRSSPPGVSLYASLLQTYSSHSFLPAADILRDIMMIKHPLEIMMLRQAIDITAKAFDRVLETTRPGMKEFEIEAEITYVLHQHGCQHAFEPIIASGASACILHYINNDRVVAEESMILLDFGASHALMNADMSRTIPASGKFSGKQLRVYDAVLRILRSTITEMKPGNTLKELNKFTGALVEKELVDLGLISMADIKAQDESVPLWKKYFMHGVSHHLGYDVHDIGDREASFQPGMVLTCEPGLYIQEWGYGVRLENDILITSEGHEDLMAQIPLDPDIIESRMRR